MDFIDRQRAAAIVSIPDDNLGSPARQRTLYCRIHFPSENAARLHVAPLSRQQLLIGIIHSARAFQIRDD